MGAMTKEEAYEQWRDARPAYGEMSRNEEADCAHAVAVEQHKRTRAETLAEMRDLVEDVIPPRMSESRLHQSIRLKSPAHIATLHLEVLLDIRDLLEAAERRAARAGRTGR